VPGVPELAYVSHLAASPRSPDTVYSTFVNHQNADLKPYAARSTDRGRTWSSITGDLPARGGVWVVIEDTAERDLLYAGTEFGLYVSRDAGHKWVKLTGGFPNVSVRDLVIQKREGDLDVATFGRGFYVLDDLSPLRAATPETLERDAVLYPVRRPTVLMPMAPLGIRGKAFQGDSYFTAPNPPFGAVFTYYLKDELKNLKKTRQQREKDLIQQGKEPEYPTPGQFRAEARDQDPTIVLTVSDAEGRVVRRVQGPPTAGIHRIAWDLRYPASTPINLKPPPPDPFVEPPSGPMVVPGKYTVSMAKLVNGQWTELSTPQSFEARGAFEIPAADRAALLAFERKVARLQRAVTEADDAIDEGKNRILHARQAILDAPAADLGLAGELISVENRLRDVEVAMKGDRALASRNEPTRPSIDDRVQSIVDAQWTATSIPTATSQDAYKYAAQAFAGELSKLRQILTVDLKKIEDALESAGAPATPGRIPVWQPE